VGNGSWFFNAWTWILENASVLVLDNKWFNSYFIVIIPSLFTFFDLNLSKPLFLVLLKSLFRIVIPCMIYSLG